MSLFARPDIMTASLINNIVGKDSPIFIVERYTNTTKLLIYTYLHSNNISSDKNKIYDKLYELLHFQWNKGLRPILP